MTKTIQTYEIAEQIQIRRNVDFLSVFLKGNSIYMTVIEDNSESDVTVNFMIRFTGDEFLPPPGRRTKYLGTCYLPNSDRHVWVVFPVAE